MSFKEISSPLEEFRLIKDLVEIEKMKKAAILNKKDRLTYTTKTPSRGHGKELSHEFEIFV